MNTTNYMTGSPDLMVKIHEEPAANATSNRHGIIFPDNFTGGHAHEDGGFITTIPSSNASLKNLGSSNAKTKPHAKISARHNY